jgi:hypothetical protein
MEDILLENKLPVQVIYAGGYNIQANSTLKRISGVNILIIYLKVNERR